MDFLDAPHAFTPAGHVAGERLAWDRVRRTRRFFGNVGTVEEGVVPAAPRGWVRAAPTAVDHDG